MPSILARIYRFVGIRHNLVRGSNGTLSLVHGCGGVGALQEMAFQEVFDGAICMDAMENVYPEDWPRVLNNFHRALKQHGYFYFTAETIENADENEIKQAFERPQQAGLPVVYGEWPGEEVYHYHPTNQQVKGWARQAGFEILKEGNGEIYYYHILVQKI